MRVPSEKRVPHFTAAPEFAMEGLNRIKLLLTTPPNLVCLLRLSSLLFLPTMGTWDMPEEWVTLAQLATELGVHATTARTIAIRCGIEPVRRRSWHSRQWPFHVTREQAEEIKARRHADGFRP